VWTTRCGPRGQGRGRGSAARRYSGSSPTPRRATATLSLGHFTLGNSLSTMSASLALDSLNSVPGRPKHGPPPSSGSSSIFDSRPAGPGTCSPGTCGRRTHPLASRSCSLCVVASTFVGGWAAQTLCAPLPPPAAVGGRATPKGVVPAQPSLRLDKGAVACVHGGRVMCQGSSCLLSGQQGGLCGGALGKKDMECEVFILDSLLPSQKSQLIFDSTMVSISACHADDPGSIPGRRAPFCLFERSC
jgi:hypothetical protein